jgi:hypothetical protein
MQRRLHVCNIRGLNSAECSGLASSVVAIIFVLFKIACVKIEVRLVGDLSHCLNFFFCFLVVGILGLIAY